MSKPNYDYEEAKQYILKHEPIFKHMERADVASDQSGIDFFSWTESNKQLHIDIKFNSAECFKKFNGGDEIILETWLDYKRKMGWSLRPDSLTDIVYFYYQENEKYNFAMPYLFLLKSLSNNKLHPVMKRRKFKPDWGSQKEFESEIAIVKRDNLCKVIEEETGIPRGILIKGSITNLYKYNSVIYDQIEQSKRMKDWKELKDWKWDVNN